MRNEATELSQYFLIITITPTSQHGVVVANLTLHSHLQFSQLTTLGPIDSGSPQHFANLAERKNFWPAIPNPMKSRFM
jgi:hypothetical protein